MLTFLFQFLSILLVGLLEVRRILLGRLYLLVILFLLRDSILVYLTLLLVDFFGLGRLAGYLFDWHYY